MPFSRTSSSQRLRMAAAGAGATALACAGLALLSPPSQAAAPAQAAAPEKHSYAGAPLNPAPYTVTQPDGTTLRVHNFGDRLSHEHRQPLDVVAAQELQLLTLLHRNLPTPLRCPLPWLPSARPAASHAPISGARAAAEAARKASAAVT